MTRGQGKTQPSAGLRGRIPGWTLLFPEAAGWAWRPLCRWSLLDHRCPKSEVLAQTRPSSSPVHFQSPELPICGGLDSQALLAPCREEQAAENPHPPWWGRKPWADPASSAARDWEPGTSREQEDGTLHCPAGASTEIPSSDPGARAEPGPGRGQRGPTLPMAQGNRRSSRPGS